MALAGAAHAQTVSNTYTDVFGNTSTTTIQNPTVVGGVITNGGFTNGYGGYNVGGYNVGGYNVNSPILGSPNVGYGVPNYGYGAPNYGYGASTVYPGQAFYVPGYTVPVCPPRFGGIPSATITQLPQVIVTPPVVNYGGNGYGYGGGNGYGYGGNGYGGGYGYVGNGYGYGGYGGGYGYGHRFPCLPPVAQLPQLYNGYGSRTQIVQGGVTLGAGGLNVSIGGTSIRSR